MNGRDDLSAVLTRLRRLRRVDDDALGAAIRGAAACLEAAADGTAPGWLHDQYADPGRAARLCAGCPVRDECIELELRLAGDRVVGLWGALGEGGRQALHHIWCAADEAAGRAPGRETGGR
jgi:WhiB family transcriptional regulator, redox-sensing transcriptional regulator